MSVEKAILFPGLKSYCEGLLRRADIPLSAAHRAAAMRVGEWIHTQVSRGLPANVIVVCTGNSRRSILGSTMGNIAAALGKHPTVRFSSGGTEPSAFNPRTIKTLQSIGVQIAEEGDPAPHGTNGERNSKYRVQWGDSESSQIVEFSKRHDDASNPQNDFCAILVCTDADKNCPIVNGASLRVSMPFEDPKEFDGQPNEEAAYAERRDQIGRAMLLAFGFGES